MLQKINQKIPVIVKFCSEKNILPVKLRWRDQEYQIKKLAYYHKFRQGRILQHIFHVTDGHLDFRLRFDSEDLSWTLEEVDDGNTD